MKICLNMIVKNETANLMRCLNSVLPYISCWNIVDTGSSDGTPDLIRGYFKSRGIHGLLHHTPFENFSQSRNAALATARDSSLVWDYLLLTDADMEFVVDQDSWLSELTGEAHDVLQRQGSLAYWNIRFVRRDSNAGYHGVTHEYFGCASAAHVRGAWFRDHATGGSRGDKVERDIRLLTEDLRQNPNNDRSWFYLAQSYKDTGKFSDAIQAYQKRIALGGWDEEVWYARRAMAQCYARLDDEANYLKSMVEAYESRPWRAETLYDLARYHREKGKNHTAVTFAQRGRAVGYPHNDVLFVEDEIYKTGFREELAIAGFYDNSIKADAHRVCDDLALDPEAPAHVRDLARGNLFHYLEPLKAHAPSFHATRITHEFPEPYVAMNPSIVEWEGKLVVNVRTVNYRINDAGQYVYPDGDPFIRTRNWLANVSNDFRLSNLAELTWDAPVSHGEVLGLEDVRLWHGDGLWGSATVLQLHPGHPRQMVKFQIAQGPLGATAHDLEELSSPHGCEKNWMPIIGRPGEFIYGLGRIWRDGRVLPCGSISNYEVSDFRGGGQCVPFDSGYLAIIHEAMNNQHYAQRMYAHRFVWLDAEFALRKVSLPFVFFDRQIEFAAGLAVQNDRVLVSFGVRDREAWLASLAVSEMVGMLR